MQKIVLHIYNLFNAMDRISEIRENNLQVCNSNSRGIALNHFIELFAKAQKFHGYLEEEV